MHQAGSRARRLRGSTIAAIVAMLIATNGGAASAARASGNNASAPVTLSAPFSNATVTDACRRYDDVFGPDDSPVDDAVACTSNGTASASTGRMTSDASIAPAEVAGFGRGDAYPNSIVSTRYRLDRDAIAVRFAFRFSVEGGTTAASDPALAYSSLALFARAATSRCDCDVRVTQQLASTVTTPIAPPGEVTIDVELRDAGGKRVPRGDVFVQANLVPFMIIATPPVQSGNTFPSPGRASVTGAATLLDITATPVR